MKCDNISDESRKLADNHCNNCKMHLMNRCSRKFAATLYCSAIVESDHSCNIYNTKFDPHRHNHVEIASQTISVHPSEFVSFKSYPHTHTYTEPTALAGPLK